MSPRKTIRERYFSASQRPGEKCGLVEYFSGASPAHGKTASETEMRQRTDRQAAENAYQAAQSRVQELITRYGEGTVLGWVTRGLPDAIISSPSKNNVKMK